MEDFIILSEHLMIGEVNPREGHLILEFYKEFSFSFGWCFVSLMIIWI
jgi:hypothetical protein